MAPRLLARLSLLVSLLGLAACDPASMVMTGASIVSVIQSEKTMGDNALSWALDKDCSLLQIARGEDYCQSRTPLLAEQYCYRNLGGITCYSKPDPTASAEIAVFSRPPDPPAQPAPMVRQERPQREFSAERR